MRTKVAAFTMVELIVVMVLAGVIFSAALLVVNIMGQQNEHQIEQHREVLAAEELRSLLQQDVFSATAIWREGPQLLLLGGPMDLSYRFEHGRATRTIEGYPSHTDTFGLYIERFEAQWKGLPQPIGLVDALMIQSHFFGQTFIIQLQKEYDHKTLLEKELNNRL